jgi:hypothetical protein
MIETSNKHTYIHYGNMRVVKYYGKYDFCKSGEALVQYIEEAQQPDSQNSISREQRIQLLAASIVASEFNDGKYIKADGFSDIVDNEYLKLNFSNKEILIGILTDYPRLLTKEILEDASVILDYLENKFAFKILADNMNDFERSIAGFLSEQILSSNVVGIASYIPTYFANNTRQEEVDDRSTNTGYLGAIGDIVLTEIEVLRSTYLPTTQFGNPGYMVNAITTDNHRLSFFTANEGIATAKNNIKISCKVKAWASTYTDDTINETKVNYVKFS